MINIKFYRREFKEIIFRFLLGIKSYRSFAYKYKSRFNSYKIFDRFNLDKDSIFIDIGANIGTVTHYINDKYSCNIDSFEPHPGAFSVLKNYFLNVDKVNCHNVCISNNSKKSKFYMHKLSISSKHLSLSRRGSLENTKKDINEDKFIYVDSKNIEDLIDKYSYIHCMKIDIEGHEYKILDKIIQNKKKINFVVCELHKDKFNDKNLNNSYDLTIAKLKKYNLLNTWFFVWN